MELFRENECKYTQTYREHADMDEDQMSRQMDTAFLLSAVHKEVFISSYICCVLPASRCLRVPEEETPGKEPAVTRMERALEDERNLDPLSKVT